MLRFETIDLIVRIAFRNLWLYRLKTIVIATLLGAGAFLAVLGLSLLKDVENSMQESIIESMSGHIQLYPANGKDDFTLFSDGMGGSDFGNIPEFARVREAALTNPNVKAFVPLGNGVAMLGRGNEMDDVIDALRTALKGQDEGIIAERMDQLRFQMQQLKTELASRKKVQKESEETRKQDEDFATAEGADFLAAVARGDEQKLQFLEIRIAPLSGEKAPIYLGYTGTEIESYTKNFPKFKIKSGESLPTEKRGILISHKVREDQLKNVSARYFDQLHKRVVRSRIAIDGDPESERIAKQLPKQYPQIVRYLDRLEASELSRKLMEININPTVNDEDLIKRLVSQLQVFLTIDDNNFSERHAWFYEHIAPKIKLYEISPGETLTLRSYTKSGYIKSVPVKVYGVFSFSGLEESDLAGSTNIIDLVTFRELYGQMSTESKKELEEMRAKVGVREVSAENAEDALFGASSEQQIESRSEAPSGGSHETLQIQHTIADTFAPSEAQDGLIINAALILKDPSQISETIASLEKPMEALGVKAMDWQKASGIAGQFVNIVRMALIFAITVIFIVALVIINNSIIVGTLNRIREIGTMRAIGAQKSFVLGMFLAETAITGFIGAVCGGLLALFILLMLHKQGIPATSPVMAFLFSGPALYPKLHWGRLIATPLVITLITTIASLYAARHATHVQPAEALQEKE